ncbi:hypothetical protein EGW08_008506, partial [Elysia chlorotica]
MKVLEIYTFLSAGHIVFIYLFGIKGTKCREIVCPRLWTFSPESETCVKVYKDPQSWHAARVTCQRYQADLVVIWNKPMDQFVYDQVVAIEIKMYWIGINDIANEGHFEYIDNITQVTYFNWESGLPNNAFAQNCVILNRRRDTMFWDDQLCSKKFFFICEYPGRCPPTPSVSRRGEFCVEVRKDARVSWTEARLRCRWSYGQLVTILNDEMNSLIW